MPEIKMKIHKNTLLHTRRFILRIPDETDYELIWSASRVPGFNDGMQWDPPSSKDELVLPLKRSLTAWDDGLGFTFTIESKKRGGERLGRISIRKTEVEGVWNIGYWTHPDHQGKGVMTEAVACILEFGFLQLKSDAITACTTTWNKASEKVLLNNRFTFSRYIEKGIKKNDQWLPENEYIISRDKWSV